MNNREYNSILKTYQEKIQRELDAGIIHPNKDGYIKKSILLSRDIHFGNTRRIQAEGKTVAQCAEKLAQKHRNAVEGVENKIRPKTFGEVAENWFDVMIAPSGKSEGNKANYNTLLRLHILPVLKNLKSFRKWQNAYTYHKPCLNTIMCGSIVLSVMSPFLSWYFIVSFFDCSIALCITVSLLL